MRIDLPRCNFKNCKYCFDSNCAKKIEYERCEYRRQKAEIEEQHQAIINALHRMKVVRAEAIREFSVLKIVDAIEIFAHELAHAAAGVEHDHDEAWESAFDALFEEYNKIGDVMFPGEEGEDG